LQVSVTIGSHMLRGFERLHVRRHIHLEEFPVDEQESLGVGEAGELREIFVLDLFQPAWPDLCQATGFVESEPSREARFL
jgi:hypothetical protein